MSYFRELFVFFSFIFFTCNLYCQDLKNECRIIADSLYQIKDYKKALEYYNKALNKNATRNGCYNAACTAALYGNKRLVFKYLKKIRKNKWAIDVKWAKKDADLTSIRETKRWKKYLRKTEKRLIRYVPLRIELSKIYDKDQLIRSDFDTFMKDHGEDYNVKLDREQMLKYVDSVNFEKVERIIHKHGIVAYSILGTKASDAICLTIQHATYEHQKEYLSLIKEAAEKDLIYPRYMALLEDRVLIRSGNQQIYGTQYFYNDEIEQFELYPVSNPQAVEANRKRVGLQTLSKHLSRYDILWRQKK